MVLIAMVVSVPDRPRRKKKRARFGAREECFRRPRNARKTGQRPGLVGRLR